MSSRWTIARPFVAYLRGHAGLAECEAVASAGLSRIVRHYVETDAGSVVELGAALASARAYQAALIVPTLGHLAGDAAALAALLASGVDFVACDHPQVKREALPALLSEAHAAQVPSARQAAADIRRAGVTTLRAIGRALDAKGIKPPAGGAWHATQVARLLPRDDL